MSDLDPLAVDRVIRDCAQFIGLLDSPVIGVVLRMTEQQHYQEFLTASTPDALQRAQAKANALNDVVATLRAVLSAGERDALEREKRETRAQAERPATE